MVKTGFGPRTGGTRASLMAQRGKNLPALQETQVQSLEEEIATHSSIFAWKITHRGSDTTERLNTHTHTLHRRDQPLAVSVSVSPRLHTRPQGGRGREVPAHGLWGNGGPRGLSQGLRVSQGSWGESWSPSLAPCPAGRVVTRLRPPPG